MERVREVRRPLGRVRFEASDDPPVFLVTAVGCIGPSLVKAVLDAAEPFGAERPNGWTYVADVRRVVFPSPRNIRLLRRIHGLSNLRSYAVVAPWLGRLLLGAFRRMTPAMAPDAIVGSFAAGALRRPGSARGAASRP